MRTGKITIELEITGDFDEDFLGYVGHAVVGRSRDAMTPGVRRVSRASWFTEMFDDSIDNGCRWNRRSEHNHSWTLWSTAHLAQRLSVVVSASVPPGRTPNPFLVPGDWYYRWEESCIAPPINHSFTYQMFRHDEFQFSENEAS